MNSNTLIWGLPPAAYSGMILFTILTIQVLGGMKVIKMPLLWHKRVGLLILAIGLLHGVFALLYFLA